MELPKLTKKDKRSKAERIMEEKVDKFVEQAETPEELLKGQQMIQNQVNIQNGKKVTILGVPVETVFTIGSSTIMVVAALNKDYIAPTISKALTFIPKGRPR